MLKPRNIGRNRPATNNKRPGNPVAMMKNKNECKYSEGYKPFPGYVLNSVYICDQVSFLNEKGGWAL